VTAAGGPGERELALIREALGDLRSPVTLDYYTPDVDSWCSRAERALLEAVAGASAAVRLRVQAGRWDAAREAEVGIARTPCIVLRGRGGAPIRYYGLPDGYELETFLAAVRAVAEDRSGLPPALVAPLAGLARPLHLEVLASPT